MYLWEKLSLVSIVASWLYWNWPNWLITAKFLSKRITVLLVNFNTKTMRSFSDLHLLNFVQVMITRRRKDKLVTPKTQLVQWASVITLRRKERMVSYICWNIKLRLIINQGQSTESLITLHLQSMQRTCTWTLNSTATFSLASLKSKHSPNWVLSVWFHNFRNILSAKFDLDEDTRTVVEEIDSDNSDDITYHEMKSFMWSENPSISDEEVQQHYARVLHVERKSFHNGWRGATVPCTSSEGSPSRRSAL
jgi:hypothetical protein